MYEETTFKHFNEVITRPASPILHLSLYVLLFKLIKTSQENGKHFTNVAENLKDSKKPQFLLMKI